MRRRVWIAAGAALVLVVALVVTGVANADDSGNYRTATARTGDVASTLDAAGTVTPTSEADLSFPVAGQVSSVPVAVGQQVAARPDPMPPVKTLLRNWNPPPRSGTPE